MYYRWCPRTAFWPAGPPLFVIIFLVSWSTNCVLSQPMFGPRMDSSVTTNRSGFVFVAKKKEMMEWHLFSFCGGAGHCVLSLVKVVHVLMGNHHSMFGWRYFLVESLQCSVDDQILGMTLQRKSLHFITTAGIQDSQTSLFGVFSSFSFQCHFKFSDVTPPLPQFPASHE